MPIIILLCTEVTIDSPLHSAQANSGVKMPTIMPDIANHTTAQTEGTLDWVGMSNIEMPIMVASEGPIRTYGFSLRRCVCKPERAKSKRHTYVAFIFTP